MTKQLQVGLIGYGFAGRTFHAPVMTAVPSLRLSKVVERSSARSKERYPWVEVVRSVEELYHDTAIDLVVITTPSTDHYSFAKAALLAGKHVIVEKPFTTTTAEADELIAIANERGLTLSVFHNRRWDGDFLTVRSIVESGMLGRIREAELRWDRYRPDVQPGRWRDASGPGTGVFYDLGVHFLDQALSLFGLPNTIQADIRTQREGATADDYFDVALGYKDGLKVTLRSSLLASQPGPRYTLYGTKGSFIKHGEDPQENLLKEGASPLDPGFGAEPSNQWGSLHTKLNGLTVVGKVETITGGYHHYFANVAAHILGEAELAVKPQQARDAIRLIELGFQSSKEGRTIEVQG